MCLSARVWDQACSALNTHHGESRGAGRVNNACPRCGWFGMNISEWLRWDGKLPEETNATQQAAAVSNRHHGEWRVQAVTRTYCAFSEGHFGPGSTRLCTHTAEMVRHDHWSCCGSRVPDSTQACVVGGASAAAAASDATAPVRPPPGGGSGSQAPARRPIAVGDQVRVAVQAPSFGWGEVRPSSIGLVMSFDDGGIATVNFPTQANWHGLGSELELVHSQPEAQGVLPPPSRTFSCSACNCSSCVLPASPTPFDLTSVYNTC